MIIYYSYSKLRTYQNIILCKILSLRLATYVLTLIVFGTSIHVFTTIRLLLKVFRAHLMRSVLEIVRRAEILVVCIYIKIMLQYSYPPKSEIIYFILIEVVKDVPCKPHRAAVLLTLVFVTVRSVLIFCTSGGVSARRHLKHGVAEYSYSTRGYYTAPQSVVGVVTYVPSILTTPKHTGDVLQLVLYFIFCSCFFHFFFYSLFLSLM